VKFVSGRMSYTTLKGRWCDAIILNVHVPTEDKDDIKIAFTMNKNRYLINSLGTI
jgi:hypothetical protein